MHLDLKTLNLAVRHDGLVTILDWGSASVVSDRFRLCSSEKVLLLIASSPPLRPCIVKIWLTQPIVLHTQLTAVNVPQVSRTVRSQVVSVSSCNVRVRLRCSTARPIS